LLDKKTHGENDGKDGDQTENDMPAAWAGFRIGHSVSPGS
jgi:hypothetical protein